MKYILSFFLISILSACGTFKSPYYSSENRDWQNTKKTSNKKLIHSLFLIGDAGKLDNSTTGENFVLNAVKADLKSTKTASSLVFLGDNLYPNGLPPEDNEARKKSEEILNAQLELAKYCEGNTYFISGNHDWKKGKKKGLKMLLRQENYIESYFNKDFKHEVKMYPGQGCGDPKVKKINKELAFVFIDSQWWLQNWNKEKKINKGCDIKSRGDLLMRLEEIFLEHKNDQIILFMHHPVFSNGQHGGKFSFYDHLFPLHHFNNLWIPLPVIGSLYPILRETSGSNQDLSNSKYQELTQGIYNIAEELNVEVIFASGHEHNLQFFDKGNTKHIISGSGSKHSFALAGGEADFTREARGYAKVLFYKDMETWLEFYTISNFDAKPQLEYRTQLRKPRAGTVKIQNTYPPISKQDTIVAANKTFAADKRKEWFLGEQYRNIWTTNVKVPFINLEEEKGGLMPIKKGGGMSSNSLRMEANDGKQYILRSINKDYTKLIDDKFSNLKVLDIMKDQNSASHPYGALIIPSLSQAAGIYYTSPKLVFLKHQKQLGNYNKFFNEELYLLEQRPSENWSNYAPFGNSKDIISYNDLLEKIREKKGHHIDQKWVLKSRMFDLLIHDWDRHDDQWRWATFEYKDSTVYRPIPRDRDQAFYKFEGFIPWYISTFVLKKFKTMKDDVHDVKNLAFNARYFDRYFLNQLEWRDWEKVIKELQANITNDVLDASLNGLPTEIVALNKEIPDLLKSRRDHLMKIGHKLYNYIAKEVEITGTDNEDKFIITRNDNGSTNIKSYVHRDNKKDLLKYNRTFYPHETKEIRLYGLRGKDKFEIKGNNQHKIKVRIIGGEDNDKITNQTSGNNILAYDLKDGIKIKGKGISDKTSVDDININEYDRRGFKYNTAFPFLRMGYTKDDGLWYGLSYSWTKHAWRNEPYKSKQKAFFEVAPGSPKAFKFGYNGHFPNAIGSIDYKPSFNVDYPSIENYFGYGNESNNNNLDKEYNWVTKTGAKIKPLLSLQSKNEHFIFDFGPSYQTTEIKAKANRVSTSADLAFTDNELRRKHFIGAEAHQTIKVVDRESNPSNGFSLYTAILYQYNLTDEDDLLTFKTNSQFYFTLSNYPKIVLANNIGFETIEGQAQFYQMPNLGNLNNLRGYRRNRFRGESLFYENIDLRLQAFNWNNNYVPVNIGLVGGYDIGRVWIENEDSNKWHTSQTIGAWFDILDMFVVQPYYTFTQEENLFSFKMSFNF